jgi:putative two-component system response regulator
MKFVVLPDGSGSGDTQPFKEAGLESGAASGQVLVVDDQAANRRVIERFLTPIGYEVRVAADGETALADIEQTPPDLIILDVQLPGLNGFEVCRAVKQNPATCFTPVILLTGLKDRESRIRGINAGADEFLSKPFDREELEARVRSLLRLKRQTDELESAESVILSLALTIEARDAYTNGHCQRRARYATALGERLGLKAVADLRALHLGGYLHDVGKVGVPDSILFKPTRLTDEEYAAVKAHTIIGDRLCGNMRSLAQVRPIVRHHHERLDGSGYPDGLRGDQIPQLAQIVGIVDTFDAVTTNRPYRAAQSFASGLAELRRDAASGLFQADFVEAFCTLELAVLARGHEASISLSAKFQASRRADIPQDVHGHHRVRGGRF